MIYVSLIFDAITFYLSLTILIRLKPELRLSRIYFCLQSVIFTQKLCSLLYGSLSGETSGFPHLQFAFLKLLATGASCMGIGPVRAILEGKVQTRGEYGV